MRLFLAVLLLLSIAFPSYAGEETVEVGSEALRIGMSEQSILEKLERYYQIDCSAAKFKSCSLFNKDGPPFTLVASLLFENGKLTKALKSWSRGYEGTDPSRLVETLYSALSKVAGSGPVEVTVQLSERREPGSVEKAILVSRGRKTISITVTEGLKYQGGTLPPFTNINEKIE